MSKKAAAYLMAQDPVLAQIIEGQPIPTSTRNTDVYRELVRSIIGQQLHIKAAEAIVARFFDQFDEGYPDPEKIVRRKIPSMRKAGLSQRKAEYIQAVAAFHLDKGIYYDHLKTMDDDDVVEYLTEIRGVGQWTVEMLLMFPLSRKDVLPVGDLGIQQAIKKLYRLRSTGPALQSRMEKIARPWQPHRTLACRYLWRSQG